MANIKKSFNFRNGVQVDDDNLKVSGTGLVGIGTTVPTEALDVRGNLVVSGVSSAVTAQAGVMTVTTLNPTEIIGAGVSIVSGIVTASSGIITFYGDARFLQGMPTSQWEDTNTGLGVSSIYNTGGNVGIATSNPQFTLQIGENPNQIGGVSGDGVGISSAGNVKASGIVTATTFSGNLSGNISGDTVVSGIATFSKDLDVGSNIQLGNAGVITATSFKGDGDFVDIDVDGHTNLDNVSVGGATTISANLNVTSNVDVGLDLDVDGHTNLDNVSVAGVSTFSEDVITGVGATVGIGTTVFFGDNVKAEFGNSQDSSIFHTGSDFIIKNTIGQFQIQTPQFGITNAAASNYGLYMVENAQIQLYFAGVKKLETTQNGVTISPQLDTTNIVASGVITATTELNSPLIGVGTDAPANDIQVRKPGNVEIQVTSDTGIAGLTVGRESGTGNTNNAELRYGGGAGANYSSAQSLDILNYGTGNFNYHLSANNAGAAVGNFYWHKGLNNERMMTLTNTGRLGIGLTTPTTALHVLGAATVSGSLTVGNNLQVEGTINSDVSGNVTGNLTGNVNGNANAAAGISTFNNLSIAGVSTFNTVKANSIGILNDPSLPLTINSGATQRFFVAANGSVGIKTTDTQGNTLLVAGSVMGQIIGAGTTQALSTVDFSLAGQGLGGDFANKMFMIPPKVTNAQRGNLAGLVSGAMIYNTNLNKLQVYNGSAWETVTSS